MEYTIYVASIILSFVQLSMQNPTAQPLSMLGTIRQCLRQTEIVNCFKRQVARSLEEAVKNDVTWPVNSYIAIKKDPNWTSNDTADATGRSSLVLDDVIARRVHDLVASRNVQISFGGLEKELEVEEGRKKKGKGGGGMLIMAGVAMAAMMAQMVMGKIAFIAGTALMIAKIALMLSSLIGLKKLTSGGGGKSERVVYAAPTDSFGGYYPGGGGWQRSMDKQDALDLAYRGHVSTDTAT